MPSSSNRGEIGKSSPRSRTTRRGIRGAPQTPKFLATSKRGSVALLDWRPSEFVVWELLSLMPQDGPMFMLSLAGRNVLLLPPDSRIGERRFTYPGITHTATLTSGQWEELMSLLGTSPST
jgi:hypothetical protein